MPLPGITGLQIARYRVYIVEFIAAAALRPQGQPQGVNEKGSNDAGVQAFEIQHQHMVIHTRNRLEYKTARAGDIVCTGSGCHIAIAM